MGKKPKAYLFGPFFGELSWEYFRFAPYAIHLKKTEPDIQMVVMTRPERFDFYGQYADVLVPLKIPNDGVYDQSAFKLLGYDISLCQKFCDIFRITYKKKYEIVDCYVPDFSSLRYKVKWQFPRGKMDYDFIPRKGNTKIIENFSRKKNIVITDVGYRYNTGRYTVINIETFKKLISSSIDNNRVTYYGCLIQLIKQSKFVISNLKSDLGKLSVLLKTPLIYPHRTISTDNVFLMNPLKTPIIDCESIIEGVKFYENSI